MNTLCQIISPTGAGWYPTSRLVELPFTRQPPTISAGNKWPTFANIRKKNQDIFAFDTKALSDSIGIEQSGILGFKMLRLLDINRLSRRTGRLQVRRNQTL